MSHNLFRAFAGRLAIMALSAMVLGGLAAQAPATRPAVPRPHAFSMACFDPATPQRGWIHCADEVPA